MQRSLPFTSAGRLCIHELFERSCRRPISTKPPFRSRAAAARSRSMSPTIASGASSTLPDAVRSTSGSRGSSGAEVHAVRVLLEHVEGQPLGVGAEAVAVGAHAQQEVEHALGAAARLELREQLAGIAARHERPLRAHLALDQRLDDHVVEARRRRRSAPGRR